MKIFLLLLSVVFLMSAKKCSIDLTGYTPAVIKSDLGYANKFTVKQSCPILTEAKIDQIEFKDMNGWVCIPPKQYAEIRREYESECK